MHSVNMSVTDSVDGVCYYTFEQTQNAYSHHITRINIYIFDMYQYYSGNYHFVIVSVLLFWFFDDDNYI